MELKNFFAQDDVGNILSEATCYVYVRGTESLVTGLQNANGVALVNPFTANQQGLIQFAAPNGLYDLRVVKGNRDNRIRVQCNDVTDTLTEMQNADLVELNGGGNTLGLLKSESVSFFDPLTRSVSTEILPGSPVGLFDNKTAFSPLLGTGRYIQNAAGVTKISGDGSAILLLPSSYGGDIDMEISMRSLYQIGGANSDAPQDANLALLLRMQDEKNYCIVQVNNSHLITASLSIRESVDGTEHVRATYSNIVVNEANPKMSNAWPTLRVILRKNRVTVSLNGVRILSNIILQKLRWAVTVSGFTSRAPSFVISKFAKIASRQHRP